MIIVPFLVNLPVETYESLNAFCHRKGVTKAEIVRGAIKRELDRRGRVPQEEVCKALK